MLMALSSWSQPSVQKILEKMQEKYQYLHRRAGAGDHDAAENGAGGQGI